MKKFFCIFLLAAHLNAYCDVVHPIQRDLNLEEQRKVFNGAHKMARTFRKGHLASVQLETSYALDAMIKRACKELRKKGFYEDAEKIEKEWTQKFVFRAKRLADIGDFEPLSDWLSATYIILELLLGKDLMKTLHLDDIHILNHAIPVVFRPCKGPWKKSDYVEHFSALSGVLAYWSTYVACTATTVGMGIILCIPAGMGAEFLMRRFLGPPIGRTIYNVACD